MDRYKKGLIGELFLSMLFSPIFILVYLLFLNKLYYVCKYGWYKYNVEITLGCMIFFFFWFILFIIRIFKLPKEVISDYSFEISGIRISYEECISFNEVKFFKIKKNYIYIVDNKKNYVLDITNKNDEIDEIGKILISNIKYKPIIAETWLSVSLIVMIFTSIFYGYKIYDDVNSYTSTLAWHLDEFNNIKSISFNSDNIYEDGIDGIFNDIREQVNLPEELYINDFFELYFDKDGRITSFSTNIYGKDSNNEDKTFLINYEKGILNKVTVELNRYLNCEYSEDMKLEPLINTVSLVDIEDFANEFNEDKYGILYYGKRSFGFNTDGIFYVDTEGNTKKLEEANSKIEGYFVSFYVPGKEDYIEPVRYCLVDDINSIASEERIDDFENKTESMQDKSVLEKVDVESFINEDEGYGLAVTGAAAGSRYYSLYKTQNGGYTWEVINSDPFDGGSGGTTGISFINEYLGFIGLSHSAGEYGELYRTEDGGSTFALVEFPELQIELIDNNKYNPFDVPSMPYKLGDKLCVLVGQGSDGDYNGNCDALYESSDNGETWVYRGEVK